jgi:hypothetical protein
VVVGVGCERVLLVGASVGVQLSVVGEVRRGWGEVRLSVMWQTDRIAGTQPYQRVESPWGVAFAGPPPPIYPVPDLVACVLPTGQVGVFPDTDCAGLGLPEADLD